MTFCPVQSHNPHPAISRLVVSIIYTITLFSAVAAVFGSKLVWRQTFKLVQCSYGRLDITISSGLGTPDTNRRSIMDHDTGPKERLKSISGGFASTEQVVFMATKMFLHHIMKPSLESVISHLSGLSMRDSRLTTG